MNFLNFRHLRYFWAVAKTGSMAKAAKQLHLTPQSISGQLAELESSLGLKLLIRAGRNLELTDAGIRVLQYADEIFSIGEDLLAAVKVQQRTKSLAFRVGIADSVSKSIAYRLIAPALQLSVPMRLVCREGRLSELLADLAVHRLDLIIADRPMPPNLSVRSYSHLLGQSPLAIFGTRELIKELTVKAFPAMLDRAKFLLPGEDFAVRVALNQWFDRHSIRPVIVGEFDDSALMKAFGQASAGFFAAPSAIAKDVCEQYGVQQLGMVDSVMVQVYAITTERRIKHPAVLAMELVARSDVFL